MSIRIIPQNQPETREPQTAEQIPPLCFPG